MAFSEELRELAQRISNWGRWGDDDQRGTGNLLTPEAARRGAESVVDGTAIPLALPLLGEGKGVQIGQPAGRLNAVADRRIRSRCRVPSGLVRSSS